jgi:hypothetical protein
MRLPSIVSSAQRALMGPFTGAGAIVKAAVPVGPEETTPASLTERYAPSASDPWLTAACHPPPDTCSPQQVRRSTHRAANAQPDGPVLAVCLEREGGGVDDVLDGLEGPRPADEAPVKRAELERSGCDISRQNAVFSHDTPS